MRELENDVHHALVLSQFDRIRPAEIQLELSTSQAAALSPAHFAT